MFDIMQTFRKLENLVSEYHGEDYKYTTMTVQKTTQHWEIMPCFL